MTPSPARLEWAAPAKNRGGQKFTKSKLETIPKRMADAKAVTGKRARAPTNFFVHQSSREKEREAAAVKARRGVSALPPRARCMPWRAFRALLAPSALAACSTTARWALLPVRRLRMRNAQRNRQSWRSRRPRGAQPLKAMALLLIAGRRARSRGKTRTLRPLKRDCRYDSCPPCVRCAGKRVDAQNC